MMRFATIRDALRRLLAVQAQGAFAVVGEQKRGKGAESVANKSLVEVYYHQGEFPKSAAGHFGPTKHDLTFRIDLTVSLPATADVATIENPESSAEAMAAAIADMKESGLAADAALDDLFTAVYQILMDARNDDLGLGLGVVSSRWVTQLQKDEPIKTGSYTVLTGRILYTCNATEDVRGYTGTVIDEPVIDVNLQLEGDTAGAAGVQVGG